MILLFKTIGIKIDLSLLSWIIFFKRSKAHPRLKSMVYHDMLWQTSSMDSIPHALAINVVDLGHRQFGMLEIVNFLLWL